MSRRLIVTPAAVVATLTLVIVGVTLALCSPVRAHARSRAIAFCEQPPCTSYSDMPILIPIYYVELSVEPDWCGYSPGDVVALLVDGSPYVPARATRWLVVPRADPDAGFWQGAYSNAGWCTNYYVQPGCAIDAGPW